MSERINKFLSAAGVCSRREADRAIEDGKVTINGITATVGSKVYEGDEVVAFGKKVNNANDMILLAFNKPVGVVSTTAAKQSPNNVVDFIGLKQRIYPIGRLDKESEGLLLMTNNGEITDKILRSVNGHEKEYVVEVNKEVTEDFITKMSAGIYLKELERKTNPCVVTKIGKRKFRIILTQGLNRQIRRMSESLGFKVIKLRRVRIMNIELGNLKSGEYRRVTGDEYNRLFEQLK